MSKAEQDELFKQYDLYRRQQYEVEFQGCYCGPCEEDRHDAHIPRFTVFIGDEEEAEDCYYCEIEEDHPCLCPECKDKPEAEPRGIPDKWHGWNR